MPVSHRTNLENEVVNHKCYTFDNEEYYKIKGMKGNYFIKIVDYAKITLRQVAIIIYEYTINGLKKIKSYIKSMESSDILFVAGPKISTHFKMYDLEKN